MFFKKRKEEEGVVSFLCHDVCMEGILECRESLRIDGKFDGELNVGFSLIIGESGSIVGKITASTVFIYGSVEGSIDTEKV